VIERRKGAWRVVARYKGLPHFSVTVGTDEALAQEFDDDLKALARLERADIFQALRDGDTEISTVHRAIFDYGLGKLTLDQCGVGGRETIGALYREWIAHVALPSSISNRTRRPLGSGTLDRYRDSWEWFFLYHPKGRSAPIRTLTTEALRAFAKARIGTDEVTPSTVNRDFTAIQSFCRWLRDIHPTVLPVLPRFQKYAEPDYTEDDRHLTPDQYRRLRSKLEPHWWMLFDLLIQTGLRIGEAQSLRCDDISATHVFVNKHLKTKKSKRKVPLTPSFSAVLQSYIKGRPGNAAVFSEYLASHDHAYHAFNRAAIAIGLCRGDPPKATRSPHSLRHSFGAAAAEAGISLLEIRDLLGHSDIGVTQRYARFSPNDDRAQKQAEMIGRLLAVENAITPSEPQTPNLVNGRKVPVRRKKEDSPYAPS
jgi:integrase